MYFVYVLQSDKNGWFYTGYAGDVEARLEQHNAGLVKATRHLTPWKVVYQEPYETETEARKREWYLKSQKSRRFILNLIKHSHQG